MITCPHCRAENPDNRTFCRKCGNQLNEPAKPSCIACGYPLKPDAKSCDRCGTPQRKKETKTTGIFSRKSKSAPPTTRPSQADVETIMVIEDRPAFQSKNASGRTHGTPTIGTSGSGSNTDRNSGGRSKSVAPSDKKGSRTPSSTSTSRHNPLITLGIAIAITGIVAASVHLLIKERTRTSSAPPTETSATAENATQSPAAATPAVSPLPVVAAPTAAEPVQTPPATALQTIVPESLNTTPSSAPIAAEASQPATGRGKTRTISLGASSPSAYADAEQRRARKQAEDTLKELLKQK